MPCNSGPYPDDDYTYRKRIEKLEAMLCALCRVVDIADALAHIDWKEAGITEKDFRDWWQEHQRRDIARREGELARERQAKLKRDALAKLTPDERKALGLDHPAQGKPVDPNYWLKMQALMQRAKIK